MVKHEFISTDEDENVCMFCPRPADEHFSEVTGIYAEDEIFGTEMPDLSRYGSLPDEW